MIKKSRPRSTGLEFLSVLCKALIIVFCHSRFRVRWSAFLWCGHVAAVSTQAAHGSNGRSTNWVIHIEIKTLVNSAYWTLLSGIVCSTRSFIFAINVFIVQPSHMMVNDLSRQYLEKKIHHGTFHNRVKSWALLLYVKTLIHKRAWSRCNASQRNWNVTLNLLLFSFLIFSHMIRWTFLKSGVRACWCLPLNVLDDKTCLIRICFYSQTNLFLKLKQNEIWLNW